MARGEVERRSLVALLGIPVAILVIRLGGWTLGISLAAIAGAGVRELFRMGRMEGARLLSGIGVLSAVALVIAATAWPTWSSWAPAALIILSALGFLSVASSILRPSPEARPLESAAIATLAPIYVGVPLGFAVLLRASETAPWLGAILLIFPIAVTWAGDSAAYFGGRRWGRRKLAPTVSPGKTVEGGIAGICGSLAMGLLIVFITERWIPGFPIGYAAAVILSLAIGVTGQIGDLAESALKRGAGVKDSGDFLPGHGGILDRFDGVLFALPVQYLVLALLGLMG